MINKIKLTTSLFRDDKSVSSVKTVVKTFVPPFRKKSRGGPKKEWHMRGEVSSFKIRHKVIPNKNGVVTKLCFENELLCNSKG